MPKNAEPSALPDLSGTGEFGLIRRIRSAARTQDPRVIRGIGDDAAVITTGGKALVTTDLLLEDVHFLRARTIPRLLGRKALSVNLSDIAAMGGKPQFALLGLAAAPSFPLADMDEIIAGLLEKAESAKVSLIGGDVCRSEKLVLALTVIGTAEPPAPVYRSGARIGDLILATGQVGDSALGLSRLLETASPLAADSVAADPLREPIMKHLDPEPRIAMGQKLAGLATSMIDLSDGIISDLGRLLEESQVPGAVIELNRLPLSSAFRAHFQVQDRLEGTALQMALTGGEDYELLFTAPDSAAERLRKIAEDEGLPITRIGRIVSEPGTRLADGEGKSAPLPPPLFEHFSAASRRER